MGCNEGFGQNSRSTVGPHGERVQKSYCKAYEAVTKLKSHCRMLRGADLQTNRK
jgi:hypothetical protein